MEEETVPKTAPGQNLFRGPQGTEGRGHEKLRKGEERGGDAAIIGLISLMLEVLAGPEVFQLRAYNLYY